MSDAEKRCYIHVGLPKTGSSYLQSIFFASKKSLAEQDLTMLPATGAGSFHLYLDVRDQLRENADPPPAFTAVERLPRQAAQVRTSRALMTQEMLAGATPAQVSRLIGQLPDWEIHVIVTLRELGGQLPSVWQERMKVRGVHSYDDFLVSMVERTGPGKRAWRTYDPVGVVERWGTAVPADRIHLVTLPPPGSPPALLLERFCRVLDVAPETLTTSTVEANSSLGMVQAELLRRVNVALGDRLPHARSGYRRVGKLYLAGEVLSPQKGTPPRMPAAYKQWCLDTCRAWVDALAAGGYDVVGDLEDLIPPDSAFVTKDQHVSDTDVADAAVHALATVLEMRSREGKHLDALTSKLASQEEELKALRGMRGGPRAQSSGLVRRLRARRDRSQA